MLLQRFPANKPDFKKLDEMLLAMQELLNDSENARLTVEELIAFQDLDGSFKLLDSYEIESDARCDFCHTPTYMGAAILMREVLLGRRDLTVKLESALQASMHRHLRGHGVEAEKGLIDAMNIFIVGGLNEFMAKETMAPLFRYMIQQILCHFRDSVTKQKTGAWGEVDREECQIIINALANIPPMRLYAAYGSNMDMAQMSQRCPNARVFCSGYADGFKFTMPFYADIEPAKGKRTPILLWEITGKCEQTLDSCEGVSSNFYLKKDIMVDVKGVQVAAMVYVMSDEYKRRKKQPHCGYTDSILRGYRDAGFDEQEFQISQ